METPEELLERWRVAVREMTALQPAAYALMHHHLRLGLDFECPLNKEQLEANRVAFFSSPEYIALREARAKVKAIADEYFAFRRANVNG